MSWTNERVALLKKLWGEGKTAAEIAKELGGVTRNAVIGKAHRLKLSNRASPIKPIAAKKPANSQPEKASVPLAKSEKPAAPKSRSVSGKEFSGRSADEISLNGVGVSMADLKEKMCRWPIGDPREEGFHFCGLNSVSGLPYCPEHGKIAYQAVSRSRVLQAEDFEDKGRSQEEEEDLQDTVAAA